MNSKYEAPVAVALSAFEAELVETDQFNRSDIGLWTGYVRHQWPLDFVHQGKRVYGFDPRPNHRKLCALLRLKKASTFEYSSKREFSRIIRERLDWGTDHPHFQTIPSGSRSKPAHGMAIKFELVKRVSLPLNIDRFPQLGWLKLDPDIAFWNAIEHDLADLYDEGNRVLKTHWTHERNPILRRRSLEYWKFKTAGKLRCYCCGFSFFKTYGERGENWIELHHEIPISKGHRKSARHDLWPVCSNCHRMIHRERDSMLKLDALKNLVAKIRIRRKS